MIISPDGHKASIHLGFSHQNEAIGIEISLDILRKGSLTALGKKDNLTRKNFKCTSKKWFYHFPFVYKNFTRKLFLYISSTLIICLSFIMSSTYSSGGLVI